MLSLIYSEILKLLRDLGLLEFDVEIFFPHDHDGLPRGYHKVKGKLSDQPHILTSKSLLVEVFLFFGILLFSKILPIVQNIVIIHGSMFTRYVTFCWIVLSLISHYNPIFNVIYSRDVLLLLVKQ